MDVQFEYEYHGHGASVGEGEVEAGHIWLDVGNALRPGVIDHHHSGRYSCTAETLCDNRNLVDELAKKIIGKDTVVVHTHEHPDTDALFSIYLLRYYLNNGDFPPKMGTIHEEGTILEYVSKVDSGNIKIKDKPATLYKVICCLVEKYPSCDNMEKYLNLIGIAIDKNNQNQFSLMEDDILEGLDEYKAEKDRVRNDEKRYKSDRDSRKRCDKTKVSLPIGEDGIISGNQVEALIWKKRPTCEFNRLWARDEGYIVTVVPQKSKRYSVEGKDIVCTDTIISIPPNAHDGEGNPYSLRPLAHLLERYEQYREVAILGDKNTKRDHSRPRGAYSDGENRFFKKPWSVTSDPWYFADDNTLVRSPRTGSLLSTEEVIKIVRTFGECYVKAHCMKVLVPLTFNPLDYSEVKSRLKNDGWSDDTKNNGLPWIKKNAYISTFIEEYKSRGNDGMEHFVILKSSLTGKVAKAHDKIDKAVKQLDVSIKGDCYIMLFKYGAGIVILEQEPFKYDHGKKQFVSFEINRLNASQNKLHEYFIDPEHPIFEPGPEKLSCLAPHFYTSIEVSSECLNMSDSLISRYAERLCDVFGNRAGFATVEKINDRTILASSRNGAVLVIATVDSKDNLNESEYAYLDRFNKEWFFMYLLTLQQKYSLIEIKRSFAYILGMDANKAAKKAAKKALKEDKKQERKAAKAKDSEDPTRKARKDAKMKGLKKEAKRKAREEAKMNADEEPKGVRKWFKELITNIAIYLGIRASKGPKELREKLIEFYATSYFTTATDDEQGDKIYCQWHESLMIKDIKTDIMEQISRHDEYISEKLTAVFNKISNWLIPLAVASTIIQVSVNSKIIVETLNDKVLKGVGGTIVEWFTALVALTGPMVIAVLGVAILVGWWTLKKKKRRYR